MNTDSDIKAARARDWDEVARLLPTLGHEAIFAVTAQAAGDLLAAVDPRPGSRLLDIGCGPAAWASLVTDRGVQLVGLDLSHEMVDTAAKRHPSAEFRQGDAEALPFPDRSFDGAVCNYSINGLPHPERGVAEALRVLVPGGRYAFVTWCVKEGNDLFAVTRDAVAKHVATPADEPRSWAPADAEALLRGAGFEHVSARVLPIAARVTRREEVLHLAYTTGRSLRLIRSFGPELHRKIEATLIDSAERFRRGDVLELAMPSVLAVGTRPSVRPDQVRP
jgi:ubiquinone/menaquinone biosynthesis C-methylase UbiE